MLWERDIDSLHYEKMADGSVKCIEDEIPFEIPDGWCFERLSNIASFSGGKTPSMACHEYWGNDVLWVTSKDMKSKYISSSVLKLSTIGAKQTQIYPAGTLLLVVRSGILRHTLPVSILLEDATINQDLKAILLYENQINEYIYICLKGLEPQIILKYTKAGATVENVTFDAFKNILIPIPPENMIDCIVSATKKAEEIVDQIKCGQDELASIINVTKSRILDLAIRGKLVPQDPTDEPASVLLEHIRAEKEELIKQGKIKRDKKESVIFRGEDNSYYDELPTGWSICSIIDIAEVELGKTLDKSKNTGSLYPYLRSVNIQWNSYDLSSLNEMRFEEDELDRYTIKEGDLVICEGGDVGRCCVWSDEDFLYQNALHRARFYGDCNPRYFMYHLMMLEGKGYLKRICNGVTIKHLTKNVLIGIPFFLPPLTEQSHIVNTIESAFAQLNKIAESLT